MQPHKDLHKSYVCLCPKVESFDYFSENIKEGKISSMKYHDCDDNENGKTCNVPVVQYDKSEISEKYYSARHPVNALIYKENDHQSPTVEVIPDTLLTNFNLMSQNHNLYDMKTVTIESHETQVMHSVEEDNGIYKGYSIMSSSQSEYDSDTDSITYKRTCEIEDFANYSSDCLKNAGIYTVEEVLRITCGKLMRLKYLYKKQLETLEHHLKEGYWNYLSQKKHEKEMCGSQHFPSVEKQEYENVQVFNATRRYHQHSDLAKEMRRRLHEQRRESRMAIRKQRPRKCMFTEGGVRCTEHVLPLAKHCIKHILSDSKQILFQACGSISGEVECKIPVLSIFQNTACVFHTDLKPYSPVLKVTETALDGHTTKDNDSAIMQTEKVCLE